MRPDDLANARADIITAKSILNLPSSTLSNNPILYNHVMYHSVQAIEKMLKGIVRDGKPKYNKVMLNKHNISYLFTKAAESRPEIVKKYEFISENSDILSTANSLRYGKVSVNRQDAESVCHIAEKMCNDFEKQYARSRKKPVKAVRSSALRYYRKLETVEFKNKKEEDKQL